MPLGIPERLARCDTGRFVNCIAEPSLTSAGEALIAFGLKLSRLVCLQEVKVGQHLETVTPSLCSPGAVTNGATRPKLANVPLLVLCIAREQQHCIGSRTHGHGRLTFRMKGPYNFPPCCDRMRCRSSNRTIGALYDMRMQGLLAGQMFPYRCVVIPGPRLQFRGMTARRYDSHRRRYDSHRLAAFSHRMMGGCSR
jgi:hypothetical protein